MARACWWEAAKQAPGGKRGGRENRRDNVIRRQRGFHVGGAVFLAFCPENRNSAPLLWRGNSWYGSLGPCLFRGWGSVLHLGVYYDRPLIPSSSSQDLFLLAVSFRGFLFVGRPLLAALWVASTMARAMVFSFFHSAFLFLCAYSISAMENFGVGAPPRIVYRSTIECHLALPQDGWMDAPDKFTYHLRSTRYCSL